MNSSKAYAVRQYTLDLNKIGIKVFPLRNTFVGKFIHITDDEWSSRMILFYMNIIYTR